MRPRVRKRRHASAKIDRAALAGAKPLEHPAQHRAHLGPRGANVIGASDVEAGLGERAETEKLRDFDRPTLIAWAPEDRFFKLTYGERLAEALPDARLGRID